MKRSMELLTMRLPFAVKSGGWLARYGRSLWGALCAPSVPARFKALRRDVGELLRIEPVFLTADREAFLDPARAARLGALAAPCAERLRNQSSGRLHLRRFCLCCNETTRMLVDYASCFEAADGSRTPNWRERLVCTQCGMNNRQRLVAKLVQQAASASARSRIYLMEQVTPIFEWVRKLPGAEAHGSEYLGHQYRGGEHVDGIRHEDVMKLSYPDASFDLIVSNDVLEHIPDPQMALRECFRVLRPGGSLLATFPFHVEKETTAVRAKLVGGRIEHLLPAQYHGNPVSPDGSLVFHDFGWDLFEVMRRAGFSAAVLEQYSSDLFGHLGPGLLVFRLPKPTATA
jgi:hypothetical protein